MSYTRLPTEKYYVRLPTEKYVEKVQEFNVLSNDYGDKILNRRYHVNYNMPTLNSPLKVIHNTPYVTRGSGSYYLRASQKEIGENMEGFSRSREDLFLPSEVLRESQIMNQYVVM